MTIYNEIFHSTEWDELDKGTITPNEAIKSICSRLPDNLKDCATKVFENWYNDVFTIDGMLNIVEKLKNKGYKLYLLSNTAQSFYEYKDNIPIMQYFNGIFTSSDCGYLKPDKEIYFAFLDKFKLNASECYFVDDMSANVETALELGMNGSAFSGNVNELAENLANANINIA